ncbi:MULTISPECIES: phosphate ABC transporter permease subunit PstC [Caproicibacterium]|jgi:phosphate transport system permease protein|uniref:Phosphate transport system permease protein n=1 Tax=Caproicibacterium lactatifermentans TaxID=2666138 RepID=A0A859DRX0_9FIRM|nr:phosphate ABC transporter permease subunit PstC [Caproicibacterium lactatifermentans]ARP50005.1 phosphate ABC transporter permease subunit PstC [Ruminococcaceae bacterium CPB6]MDD4807491.1 phosphate ABC transporter permease subunit PstC [Oscillospiraceae bacterium]QKN24215.1 phosphate ABC transporter permease subunit PstC [Caproicibacterium lactatifermentans]QKO30716.1 phosphate ABC transporter permease subunit PstC [Caproicibacterium lactatifermentans]
MKGKHKVRKDNAGRIVVTAFGIFMIAITFAIGIFLAYKGLGTFTKYGHSVGEFLFSSHWDPADDFTGGGSVGAAVFIVGSLLTCGLALLIALPGSIASAVFMTEISPRFGERVFQPAAEIFVGIPSVVYGWVGMSVLVPFIRRVFHLQMGYGVLTAAIVLAIMIYPSITTVSADAIRGVSRSCREASYGLGATRWQTIYKTVLPSAKSGIFTGIILGLARAFGEALAVAMVIGQRKAFPVNIFSPTTNLTAAIAADMGGAAEGGEYNTALWTMALLLLLISLLFIFLVHLILGKAEKGK